MLSPAALTIQRTLDHQLRLTELTGQLHQHHLDLCGVHFHCTQPHRVEDIGELPGDRQCLFSFPTSLSYP